MAEIVISGDGDLVQGSGQQLQAWAEMVYMFLDSRGSQNTRRAYEIAIREMLDYTGKNPWDVQPGDLHSWVADLKAQGLASSTIRLKVAAISSFFNFAINEYKLMDANPASSQALRPRVNLYSNSDYLTQDEISALLGVIDRETPQGLLDYALFLFFIFTGRRNSELRNLKWGDLQQRGDHIFYRWAGKGKSRWDELPGVVYTALRDYRIQLDLAAAENDYIFTPLTDAAVNFPDVDPRKWNRNRPLSIPELNRRIKKYGQAAGLDPARLHIHILRHSAAMLRKAAGLPIENISGFLNHSSVAVTQIYIHNLQGHLDDSWEMVADLLNLKGS